MSVKKMKTKIPAYNIQEENNLYFGNNDVLELVYNQR